MVKRIGGEAVEGIIIREEGVIAEAKKLHGGNPRYVEQQFEEIRKTGLTIGVLSADLQEAVELRFGDLFNETGERLVAVAVGEAAVDAAQDKLAALLLTAVAGMDVSDRFKVAVFSPFDSDLMAANRNAMICVRAGSKKEKWDDACADNLTSALALIDFDKAELPSDPS